MYQRNVEVTQLRKGLKRADAELWNSQALGQCKMSLPVEQDTGVEYPLSEAKGPALSVRYPVTVTHGGVVGGKKKQCRSS